MSNLPTRIYLTGFMGSGKSTIGPILANVLGYTFMDLDSLISARAGESVRRLFVEEGEAGFRRLEAQTLRETGEHERLVVATGGGALVSDENMQWARDHGVVVYLHVSSERLAERLLHSPTVRPLILDGQGKKLGPEALHERIKQILQQREPYYRRADVVVEVGAMSVGPTVDAVAKALRDYARSSRAQEL